MISQSQLEGLRRTARSYQPGEVICLEGEPTRDLLFVIQGAVDVLQNDEVVKTVRGQQMFMGQIAFFANRRRTATLRAKTRCEVVRIREEKIDQLLSAMPTLGLRLIRDLTTMFIEKEAELARYRTYGSHAHQAMKAEELVDSLHKYLPFVLVSLMQDLPEYSRLSLGMGLLDALSSHISMDGIVMNKVDLPSEIRSREVRAQFSQAMLTLLREKSERSIMSELTDSERERLTGILPATHEFEDLLADLTEQKLTVGAEHELRGLRREAQKLPVLVEQQRVGDALDALERSMAHLDKMKGFSGLQRASNEYGTMVEDAIERAHNIYETIKSLADLNREGTVRKQILDHLKFEI